MPRQTLAEAQSLIAVLKKANSEQANVIAELTSLRTAEKGWVEEIALGLMASKLDILRDERMWEDAIQH